jgi:Mannosyltransferase (PIG-V)).
MYSGRFPALLRRGFGDIVEIMEEKPLWNRIRSYIRTLSVAALTIDVIGIAVLTVLVASWWRSGQSAVNHAAAVGSAGLFAVLGLCFAPRWVEAWSRRKQPETPMNTAASKLLTRVFLTLLVEDAVVIGLVYLLRCGWVQREGFAESLSFWRCLDSNSYLEIAQYGYMAEGARAVQLVFLPGYPLVVRAVHLLVGGDYVYAGLVTAGLCFAGAGTMFCALVCLDYGQRAGLRAVKYLCVLPGAFFYAAPMSESLFLLLSLACVYCVRRKRWFAACALGGLAAFTRTIGLVMAALVFFELIADLVAAPPKGARQIGLYAFRFAALLLIPAGFACYCAINYRVTGDALRFLTYQKEHWSQSLGYFFNTASYQAGYAAGCLQSGKIKDFGALWLPQVLASAAALAVLIVAVKKLRPSYVFYAIGYYIIAIGCTWLLSAVRYLAALFPIPMALAILGRNRRVDAEMTIILLLLSAAYLYMFVNRWQVW